MIIEMEFFTDWMLAAAVVAYPAYDDKGRAEDPGSDTI